jgi:hypothetical protein
MPHQTWWFADCKYERDRVIHGRISTTEGTENTAVLVENPGYHRISSVFSLMLAGQ